MRDSQDKRYPKEVLAAAMKHLLRRVIILTADKLENTSKLLRGAADKVIPEKRIFLLDLEKCGWKTVRPCFVLSTGRCGTLLLNELLLLSPNADPNHEPKPELYRPSKRAYEEIDRFPEIFSEVFKSAREEYLLKAAKQDKIYIETNNQSTFFAPIIPAVFPNAIFIHLVRHPGSFVRSGIRRRWYSEGHSHDIGRIVPKDPKTIQKWTNYTLIEKNGWLWNETNQFILDFLTKISLDKQLFIKAEDLFVQPEITRKVYDFIGLEGFDIKSIKRLLKHPVNQQVKGEFPKYKDWSKAEKSGLKNVAVLAEKFGYTL